MKILLAAIVVIVLGVPLALVLLSSDAAVAVDQQIRVLGQDTPVVVRVTSPHGVRKVSAAIEQNGNVYPVFETTRPARRLFFFRSSETSPVFRFGAGRKQAPG